MNSDDEFGGVQFMARITIATQVIALGFTSICCENIWHWLDVTASKTCPPRPCRSLHNSIPIVYKEMLFSRQSWYTKFAYPYLILSLPLGPVAHHWEIRQVGNKAVRHAPAPCNLLCFWQWIKFPIFARRILVRHITRKYTNHKAYLQS